VLDRSGEWGFVNWRAAGWWTLRECLDPTGPTKTMIPYQEDLIGELTATRRKAYTSKSQIVLESKEEIRKRLQGASPDRVDSIIHALAGPGLWQAAMATV